MRLDDRDARERVARVEALLTEVERLPESARTVTTETLGALLDLYGEGLARVLEITSRTDGDGALRAFMEDELVSHLLLLHGLHPLDLETRVLGALEEVRPYLQSHGGDVEFLGIEEGRARLRLRGSCSGCPSSAVTLRQTVEEAVQRAAPELEGIVADEGLVGASPTFVPLTTLSAD